MKTVLRRTDSAHENRPNEGGAKENSATENEWC